MTTLRGALDAVRFQNETGTFSVAVVLLEDGSRATIVGDTLNARVGENVEVIGRWETHSKFGKQFAIESIQVVLPTSEEAIKKYLGSGLVDGIGAILAERIVNHFGEKTLDVIDDNPRKILSVPGIGKKRAEKIANAWEAQRSIRHVMTFLHDVGLSPTFAVKVHKRFGNEAVNVVRDDPYQLARDIFGIGFRRADEIAAELGIAKDSPKRVVSGVAFALRESRLEGHTYLPEPALRERAVELLGVDDKLLSSAINSLIDAGEIVAEFAEGSDLRLLFWKRLWVAEVAGFEHVERILREPRRFRPRSIEHHLTEVESDLGFELAPAQRRAVRTAWTQKICVITGGPGTGKTTIVRAVCELGSALGQRVALAAPTGRAAKRLGEATGRTAKTVHRLLEFSWKDGGFQLNAQNPMDVDMLIIDEASMVDTYLFAAIVASLPSRAALLFVGDVDQLPSVGPGNVLSDVIRSGVVEVVRLTEIFRQAQESKIVTNAHRINRGLAPTVSPGDTLTDFYTINANSPEDAQSKIVHLVTERIPNAFGFNAKTEVQVLSPMHRGSVGCSTLNTILQEKLTDENAGSLQRAGSLWKVGDKVMQTRNNYDLDIYNGDIGRIIEINRRTEKIGVMFDRRLVSLEYSQLDDMTHAYAITVHKSQGSEYPAVVMPLLTQHFVMLQRNLLYTAVTRAKSLVVIVGSPQALEMAVKNDQSARRYSRLGWRLQHVLVDEEEE